MNTAAVHLPAPHPSFRLLRAAQLLDGRGGPPVAHAAVLLEGATIRAVGRAAEVRAPDGAPVTEHDYGKATILPGLIDTHTHLDGFGDGRPGEDLAALPDEILLLQAARNAGLHLEAGVTTLRDCGTKGQTGFALRRAATMSILATPRLMLCGRPITITGGHMWHFGMEVMTPRAVERRGASVSFAHPRATEVGAALAERNVLVWAGDGRVRASAHLFNDSGDVTRYLEALAAVLPGLAH